MTNTAKQYADELIDALEADGIRAEIIPTGGNCQAISVLGKGGDVLITNADANLPDPSREGEEAELLMLDYRTDDEGAELLYIGANGDLFNAPTAEDLLLDVHTTSSIIAQALMD